MQFPHLFYDYYVQVTSETLISNQHPELKLKKQKRKKQNENALMKCGVLTSTDGIIKIHNQIKSKLINTH